MQNIILLGAGGHCKSTIEILETRKDDFFIKGILDADVKGKLLGYPILGNDDLIKSLVQDNFFIITVGSIKSTKIREKIAEKVLNTGGKFATVISMSASVSTRAIIGNGTVVFNNVNINSDCEIGKNCILNTAANIEHDCKIGNFVHVSTGAMINGGCNIGDRCFIGSNATIANGVTICDDVVIGAGSVVAKNITELGTYVGNPARKIDVEMEIVNMKNTGGGVNYRLIFTNPLSARRIA